MIDLQNIHRFPAGGCEPYIHASDSTISRMFQRYLLEKALSRFKFEYPEEWSGVYYTYGLFCHGYMPIIKTQKFGAVPMFGALLGKDLWYQPNQVVINNPLINRTEPFNLGKDAVLIKLQPDYGGIWDIIEQHANLMAIAMESMKMNLFQAKFAWAFASDNKAAAESFKKMFEEVSAGKPAVFMDKNLFRDDGEPNWFEFNQNLQQNYIADKLLTTLQQIESRFDTLIGIPNVNVSKTSGVTSDEVNANNISTYSLVNLWLEEMNKGMQKANEMFGLNLSVKLREMEGDELYDQTAEDHDLGSV